MRVLSTLKIAAEIRPALLALPLTITAFVWGKQASLRYRTHLLI